MPSAEKQDEDFLAPHYTWMGGGHDQAVQANRDLFQRLGIVPRLGGKALDLGCGSGFQSLALADLGFAVTGIDTSAELLRELQSQATGKAVTTVCGDLRESYRYQANGPFEVAICMGDTLVHLPTFEDVATCLEQVHRSMERGGKLVLSFRDLTVALHGIDRAIPVRLDENKLMSTFLEFEAHHVAVHDMLFIREKGEWTMHKNRYRKLRLGPTRVIELLGQIGFQDTSHAIERGFSLITAVAC